MIATWQATLPDGKTSEELLVSFDQGREWRILILPGWFDEANKLRRFTLQLMRALDEAGVDSFLPDLPGCNESLVPLEAQTLAGWASHAKAAAEQVGATHVLAIRAGALIAPTELPGWHYAAQSGAKLLRGMIRARMIASRETGREESSEALLVESRREGLTLAGWSLGPTMIADLEEAEPIATEFRQAVAAKDLGGAGLWLRAEPGEDFAQSQVLAGIVSQSHEAAS